jgi:hypothetical protein
MSMTHTAAGAIAKAAPKSKRREWAAMFGIFALKRREAREARRAVREANLETLKRRQGFYASGVAQGASLLDEARHD